jgi:hypothetical protein
VTSLGSVTRHHTVELTNNAEEFGLDADHHWATAAIGYWPSIKRS